MRKIIQNYLCFFLTALIVFSAGSGHAEQIRTKYLLKKPGIRKQQDGSDILFYENSYQTGVTGGPTIPVLPIAILLPPGNIAKSISFELKNNNRLNGSYFLSPKQYPTRSGFSSNEHQFNQQLYNSKNVLQNSFPELTTHFFHGHSIALSYFSPIEYIPADSIVYYYEELIVTLETDFDIKAIQALDYYHYSPKIKNELSNFVHNFDKAISQYPCKVTSAFYDYLIITINDFIDDYEPLRLFHNELGVKTKIVSLQDIYSASTGIDEQEKIRNYIIEQYQLNGISFVLLAGDADTNENGQQQVPIRNFYCEVLSGGNTISSPAIPTDLYYSALDGNWNQNDNAKWGEPGEDDLLPELYVARICADNSDEISAIINKIINYQNYPVIKDATKMLMVGEKLYDDPLSFGSDYLDLLIGGKNDNGYFTNGMPNDLDFTYLYDRMLGKWQTGDLFQAVNDGYNIIHHSGHTSAGYMARMNKYDITNSNFNSVDGVNHLNPIVYSHGCSAAAVDLIDSNGDDCIAEKMLEIEKFAVAFVGNTRYGWFNEGQTEGPSLHLHREFLNALYDKEINTIGAAHTWSRISSAPFVTLPDQWEPGALRWCFYGCNVLGDAAMTVWTNEILEFENIAYPDPITDNFQIQTGVADSKVTLSSNGEIVKTLVSDDNGDSWFIFDSTFTISNFKLAVSAKNYKPFFIEIVAPPFPSEVSELVINDLEFGLSPAYPNPFNPATNIKFTTTRSSHVSLIVFNTLGQQIRTIIDELKEPGEHKTTWDGKDVFGNPAANGLYFFKLKTIEGTKLGSCVLLK
ncbi:T9SS type A sorting domain-containing protein [candidate division KSB1 bacterium]|nr:T9SS type A sorting domain-containing protein [candidate division KSB1 bacterium]